MADEKGFEPLACSLGGCRHIQARPLVLKGVINDIT